MAGPLAARSLGVVVVGLGGLGASRAAWGYHAVAGLGRVDSVFNAAVTRSGMGPARSLGLGPGLAAPGLDVPSA